MPSPQQNGKQRLLALAAGHIPRSSKPAQDLRTHGGKVKGPGTPTSDSVDAKLSTEEFVLPADTTRKVGLRRLNQLVAATHKPTGEAKKPHHYADGGLVEDEEEAAAIASAATPPAVVQAPNLGRDELIAQIPMDTERQAPKAQEPGTLDGLKQSEVGRQVYNTAMALPGAGGVVRAAATGGAISTGLNRLAAIGNAVGNTAAGEGAVQEAVAMGADYARNFPVGTAQAGNLPDSKPLAAPTTGAANAATSVGPQAEASSANADVSQVTPGSRMTAGIYSHGRGQYSDNAQGMGFAQGFTGNPSAQDDRSMAGLAGVSPSAQSPVGMTAEEAQRTGLIGERVGYNPAYDQRLTSAGQSDGLSNVAQSTGDTDKASESWRNFTNRMISMERGQTTDSKNTSSTPQMGRVTATHSGNDWTTRETLRRAKMDASSLIHQSHWAKKGSGQAAQKAYGEMQQADMAAMTQGQTGADVEVMKQNAGLNREGMGQQEATSRAQMQEAGANRREGLRSLADMTKFDRDSQEHTVRMRGLNRMDNAQEELVKAQSPDQVSSARARLLALHGKSGQEQTRWRSGNDQNGNPFLYNEATAETRPMRAPAAAQAPAEGSHHRGSDGRQYVMRNGQYVPVEIR